MSAQTAGIAPRPHAHVFLGSGHESSERRTWVVIWLCGAMMIAGIVGGLLFGSIALVADGLHVSTHAGALLLAALAYTYSRRHAEDQRFTFGTGKLADLAGFTSAIILAMIALLIGYESITRLFSPVPIHFAEAIPIACLGLAVNVASAWLLSSAGHDHGHSRGHSHGAPTSEEDDGDEGAHRVQTAAGSVVLEIFEHGVPPRFRLFGDGAPLRTSQPVTIEPFGRTTNGSRSPWSIEAAFSSQPRRSRNRTRSLRIGGEDYALTFEEHEHAHGAAHRDNNMRAAIVHVLADAAVSVLVIVGLLLARAFGWLWMDPLAGIVGACVIGSWSYGLVRDTGAILLDMNPDRRLRERPPSHRDRGRLPGRPAPLAIRSWAPRCDRVRRHR